MKANKLFLFQPASKWIYCGGGTLICANDVGEAILIGNQIPIYKGSESCYKFSLNEPTTDECYVWVFVKEFVLAESQEVGLVFQDYNYA